MENWCLVRTLMGMARHWQTGEPLPGRVQQAAQRRTFNAGLATLRQFTLP